MSLDGTDSGLEKALIIYYGILQTAHLLGIVITGLTWIRGGGLGVLARPPLTGWSAQAIHFLVGTGLVDFFIAIGAVIFVVRYLKGFRGSEILGAVVLTGSLYSAAVYAYGTIRSGAWQLHPMTYLLMTTAFIPVILLAITYLGGHLRADGESG